MTKFITIAIKEAKNSELLQKHGSILICDEKIFSGYNHFTDHKNSIAIHAEEHAIRRFISWCRTKYFSDSYIRRKLRKSLLITIRVKGDCIKCSAPCRDCIKLIKNYEIKQIIYSDNIYDIDIDNEELEYQCNLVNKKVRDIQNRPSSGYRWRERNKKK